MIRRVSATDFDGAGFRAAAAFGMRRLYADGNRVWCDPGIQTGSWTERISASCRFGRCDGSQEGNQRLVPLKARSPDHDGFADVHGETRVDDGSIGGTDRR